MDFNKVINDTLNKIKELTSVFVTKSLEGITLIVRGIVAILSALKVKLDETLEARKEITLTGTENTVTSIQNSGKLRGSYTFLATREGSNVSTLFSASSKYDNLFIEVEVLNANYDSWRQVRYGQLDLAGKSIIFENVPTGSGVARLRYPKYQNGHNVWPILAEVVI